MPARRRAEATGPTAHRLPPFSHHPAVADSAIRQAVGGQGIDPADRRPAGVSCRFGIGDTDAVRREHFLARVRDELARL